MDKKQKKRIKNILSGEITDSTGIISGHRKKYLEHKEGDVWEEDGKTWTIKDGIKQSISVLSDLKRELMMPMFCPECNQIMRKQKDKAAWHQFGYCLDCLVEKDTQRMIDGTFYEYEKSIIESNIESWTKETVESLKDFLKTADSNYYVTEMGDIEDWSLDENKERLKTLVDEKIKELENKNE